MSKAKIRSSKQRNGVEWEGSTEALHSVSTVVTASLDHSREDAPNLNRERAPHRQL